MPFFLINFKQITTLWLKLNVYNKLKICISTQRSIATNQVLGLFDSLKKYQITVESPVRHKSCNAIQAHCWLHSSCFVRFKSMETVVLKQSNMIYLEPLFLQCCWQLQIATIIHVAREALS